MSAALPPMVKYASAVGHMSNDKLAANVATPLQYASAGDSPPTTLLHFTLGLQDNFI